MGSLGSELRPGLGCSELPWAQSSAPSHVVGGILFGYVIYAAGLGISACQERNPRVGEAAHTL